MKFIALNEWKFINLNHVIKVERCSINPKELLFIGVNGQIIGRREFKSEEELKAWVTQNLFNGEEVFVKTRREGKSG